jgi:hypothetical protein
MELNYPFLALYKTLRSPLKKTEAAVSQIKKPTKNGFLISSGMGQSNKQRQNETKERSPKLIIIKKETP